MNYIKALKIYNDRKGEKNEWCVYKKGTPEYLEVMKIMKDFKEKPIKEKAANVISNAFKIKQAKQELEKLKLEKAKKELQKNKFLDDGEDNQGLNIYKASLGRDFLDDKLINKMIDNYNEIIKLKKDILNTSNYEDFINLKSRIEELNKDIKKIEREVLRILKEKDIQETIKLKKYREENPEPKPQVNKRIKELKTSTYIPSNYLFNKEFYFDNDVWDKKYTMTDLINNWDTDIIPIIFYNIEPKLYNTFEDMVKRVNGLTSKRGLKKDTSLIIPELLVFTKDINKKIVEHYIKEAGTRKYKYKYAIDKLYMGMFRIIERIYIELNIPRTNITNVFGDDQETVYLRGVKQGLPLLTLQNASKEMLFFDDKQGTFIRNPETLL